jgi:hypothetical protein
MNPNDLFPLFASLVGAPAFVAAGINVAKYFGFVEDGQAPRIVLYANIVIFVGVAIAYFTGNVSIITEIDAELGSLATFLLTLVAFLSELGLAKLFNFGLRGTPVLGTSHSDGVG